METPQANTPSRSDTTERAPSEPRPSTSQSDTSVSGTNSSQSEQQRHNMMEQGQFSLPRDQRTKVKEGKVFAGSPRKEVTGTGVQLTTIESAGSDQTSVDSLKSIYVGRLSAKTTINSLNNHLQQQGITQISDIVDLKCKIPGQSSFCIVADYVNA